MSQKAAVQCPKCGAQEMWDNRLSKKNPNAPDFKCTDRACDGVIWPPRNGAKAAAATPAPAPAAPRTVKQPTTIGGPLPFEGDSQLTPIADRYASCLQAARLIAADQGISEQQPTVAIAAAMFIEWNKRHQ